LHQKEKFGKNEMGEFSSSKRGKEGKQMPLKGQSCTITQYTWEESRLQQTLQPTCGQNIKAAYAAGAHRIGGTGGPKGEGLKQEGEPIDISGPNRKGFSGQV